MIQEFQTSSLLHSLPPMPVSYIPRHTQAPSIPQKLFLTFFLLPTPSTHSRFSLSFSDSFTCSKTQSPQTQPMKDFFTGSDNPRTTHFFWIHFIRGSLPPKLNPSLPCSLNRCFMPSGRWLHFLELNCDLVSN